MPVSSPPPHPDANSMAFDRTWLAHERTLMAWVRTAISFITFGFTIYKFFQYEVQQGLRRHNALLTPRDFGMGMIVIGIAGLIMATIQRHRQIKPLEAEFHVHRASSSEMVAVLVSLFGVAALLSVWFRA